MSQAIYGRLIDGEVVAESGIDVRKLRPMEGGATQVTYWHPESALMEQTFERVTIENED